MPRDTWFPRRYRMINATSVRKEASKTDMIKETARQFEILNTKRWYIMKLSSVIVSDSGKGGASSL